MTKGAVLTMTKSTAIDYMEAGERDASDAPRADGSALMLDDAAMEHVVAAGYDPVYGARPLKRAFQRLVENPLANALLEKGFERDTVVRATWQDGELVLT